MKISIKNLTLRAYWVAALAIMTTTTTTALAQGGDDVARQIDIPAGPMSSSLRAVSRTFGINLMAPDDLLAGRSAPAVSGMMSAEDALRHLLRGTNLAVAATEQGAYVIERRNASPAVAPTRTSSPSTDPGNHRIEVIVVKGTKLPSTRQGSDVSVEILSEARLDRDRIIDLSDLFLKTANVSGNGGDNGQFSIRGIGRQGFAGHGP